jgi:hypothetical protein
MKLSKDPSFWLAIVILLASLYFSLATAFRWLDIRFRIGPYFVTHWLSWIGTLFIAVYTPIYYIVKRRSPHIIKYLIPIHMHGNLLSFMFISMHFFQQITRPPQFYPDLGTGVALYLVMLILVSTGFLHRFQLLRSFVPHQNRFLHISITLAFYVVIGIHTLQGVGVF